MERIKATYIGNAGFLLEWDGKKLLIDGIYTINSAASLFSNTPEETSEAMILGKGIFRDINYILFTHNHGDHMDPQKVLKYLEKNNIHRIIFSDGDGNIKDFKDSLEEMKIPYTSMDLELGREKEIDLGDIRIKYFRTLHEGKIYEDVENYGFIIEIMNRRILVLGDCTFDGKGLKDILEGEKIDFAFLNFPMITLRRGQRVIRDIIKPEKIIVIHLPFKADDFNDFHGEVIRSIERYKKELPPIEVFTKANQKIYL